MPVFYNWQAACETREALLYLENYIKEWISFNPVLEVTNIFFSFVKEYLN